MSERQATREEAERFHAAGRWFKRAGESGMVKTFSLSPESAIESLAAFIAEREAAARAAGFSRAIAMAAAALENADMIPNHEAEGENAHHGCAWMRSEAVDIVAAIRDDGAAPGEGVKG